MEFRERKGYTTTDGHRYVSVPTDVPKSWAQWYDQEDQTLHYGTGEYSIIRLPYGQGGSFTYSVQRDVDGHLTEIGFLYSRLKDAKEKAIRNAQGLDFFHWA